MARHTVGKAFKIGKKDVKGYGYAKPKRSSRYRKNPPPVSAIAAINGPGAYRRRVTTARQAMRGLSANRRRARAKSLTRGERSAFASRMAAAKRRKDSTMLTNRRRRRRATPAQLRALAKGRAALRRRRGGRMSSNIRRRKRRRAAPKRRRKLASNRRRSIRRAAPRRRRRLSPNRWRRTRRAAPRKRIRRNASRRRVVRRKRRAAPRKRLRRNVSRKRSAAAKKGWRKRRARGGLRRNVRRRKTRRAAPRRRRRRMTSNRRRRLRRNVSRKRSAAAKKGWRNQGIKTTLLNALKVGGLVVAGIAVQKGFAKLVSDYVVDRVIGSPTQAPAVTGLGSLQPYRNVIGGLLAATAGILVTSRFVKDAETRQYLIAGMAGGVLHTILITALERVGQPKAAAYLSGYEDATAARLSAMYGYGGTSIQPMYAPIQGLGASPYEAAAGMGEYFESGVEGLGNYGPNPDMMQAAAGYGALPEYQGTHISPTSDLDAQLSIAEAAAGVGVYPELQQAAAGMGEYFANPNAPMMGLGEFLAPGGGGGVGPIPAASTWVPGQAEPQLWAGTKAVSRPQGATASTPGGLLSTPGGSGVFG